MTNKQPDALRLAQDLMGIFISEEIHANKAQQIAALLRTQHAAIERKDALLRQALDALCLPCDCSSLELSKPVGTAVDAIIKELSQ